MSLSINVCVYLFDVDDKDDDGDDNDNADDYEDDDDNDGGWVGQLVGGFDQAVGRFGRLVSQLVGLWV